jgi:hypothetical protein
MEQGAGNECEMVWFENVLLYFAALSDVCKFSMNIARDCTELTHELIPNGDL